MSRPIKNIIGPQVRRLRSERVWSQPALAAACQRIGYDINRDTIAKIEAQNRWVSDFETILFSRIFSVPFAALMPSTMRTKEELAAFLSRPTTRRL